MKVYSTIKTDIKKAALIKGSSIAGVGILSWVLGAVFMDRQQLQDYGWLVFLFGLVLLAVGMIPYKRLTRLENSPNEIVFDGEIFSYYRRGLPAFTIPAESIKETIYLEKTEPYGIGIQLKTPLPKPVTVQDPHLDMVDFQKKSQRGYGCDLFLPYFSRRTYQELFIS